ncbi:MAG TPA: choice-of-anchor Q domain-containing protein [Rudaea sp.]|jgi:hypothetical protein
MKITLILLVILAGALSVVEAAATTHVACVDSANQLADALSALSVSTGNSDADEIRVQVGTYIAPAGGFIASVTNHHNLTIRGGYVDATCTQQVADAALTVLDANHAAGVLTINTIEIPDSDIEVSDLTFQNGNASNASGSNAGGLKIGDPNPISGGRILVERNIFRNNSSVSNGFSQAVGGLLAATDGTSLVVRGNLFVDNSSPNAAAASFYSDNEIDVANNTFAGNHSTNALLHTRVTIDYTTFTGLKLSDNIFWGNNIGSGIFDVNLSPGGPGQIGATLANNDIEAATGTAVAATSILHVDPAFVGNDDFRLSASSPLIGAGIDDPPGGLANIDLDGAPRIDGTTVDLGAFESSFIFSDGFD